MAKGLEQHWGPLTPAECAAGMAVASKNARRLLEDAQSLLAEGRYPSAAALAVLSIEESGKTSVLREVAVAKDAAALRTAWRAYRSHTSKNATWLLPSLVHGGARTLWDLSSLFDRESDHPQLLENLKQVAIYTDCLGRRRNWSQPEAVIDEHVAGMLVTVAGVLCTEKNSSDEVVSAWVEHMSPVMGGTTTEMLSGFSGYVEALRALGLEQHADGLRRFVFGAGITSDDPQGTPPSERRPA